MAIRTYQQISADRRQGVGALGLAATLGLLALAGCSAPSAPDAHSGDYRAEASPPPPLMGGAPDPAQDGSGLMGGVPGEVHQGQALPAAASRHEGVVSFRRADGVLVTTMRPIANPEDMTAEERRRVYGDRPARAATVPSQRAYSPDARVAPAPVRSPAPVAAAPAAPAKPAPAAKAPTPSAPQASAPAAKAPAPKAPAAPAPVTSAPAPAPEAETSKGGGFFSFLERFKFWERDDSETVAEGAEQAADQAVDLAGEAADVASTAAADAGEAVENEGISTRTILLALAVLAAVLVLAAISRNAAAKRREAQRRRRFQTFGYGSSASTYADEPEDTKGPGLAAPLAAAAAGAVAATAFAHHQDKADGQDHGHDHGSADDHKDAGHAHDDHHGDHHGEAHEAKPEHEHA